jgi:hypothetical protein
MNISITFLFAVSCCPIPLHAQTQSLPSVPLAGCYEIVSATWHPWNEDTSPIPSRFQLLKEPLDERSNEILQMRSLPANHNIMEKGWFWRAKGDRLWISLGTGLGGFRGTLKQQHDAEFVGQIKEWCDSHCGWKTRTAKIRIRKTDCTH